MVVPWGHGPHGPHGLCDPHGSVIPISSAQDVDSLSAATLLNSEEILDANNADCGDVLDGPQGRIALEQLRFVHQNQSIQGLMGDVASSVWAHTVGGIVGNSWLYLVLVSSSSSHGHGCIHSYSHSQS